MPKTIKLTYEQITTSHNSRIWDAAYRYAIGIYSPEDVFNEIVVHLLEHEWDFEPTLCQHTQKRVNWNPAHVNRVIESRAIDIYRHEARRRISKPIEAFATIAAHNSNPINVRLVERVLTDLTSLSESEKDIVRQLVFPDQSVIKRAQKDQRKAQRESQSGTMIRMNIHGAPVVKTEYVADFLNTSKATISRVAVKLREALLT